MFGKDRNNGPTEASRNHDHRRAARRLPGRIPVMLIGLSLAMVVSAGPASASVPGLVRISATSISNSDSYKYVTATCPEGKRLIGTGGSVAGGLGEVVMDDITPRESPTGPPASVRVYAYETDPYAGNWTVTAYAICAYPLVGLEWVSATSASNSGGKSVTASCPAGKKLLGTGGRLVGAKGNVLMNYMAPNGSSTVAPTNVTVSASEPETYAANWSVTAHAICANPVAGLVRISRFGALGDSDSKMVSATCPTGTRLLNAAGAIVVHVDDPGTRNDYVISGLVPSTTSVTLTAHEEDPIVSDWTVSAYAICATA